MVNTMTPNLLKKQNTENENNGKINIILCGLVCFFSILVIAYNHIYTIKSFFILNLILFFLSVILYCGRFLFYSNSLKKIENISKIASVFIKMSLSFSIFISAIAIIYLLYYLIIKFIM